MSLREEIDALQGHVHDAVLKLLHRLVDHLDGEPAPAPDPVMAPMEPIDLALVGETVSEPLQPPVAEDMSVSVAAGVGEPTVVITPPPTEGQP